MTQQEKDSRKQELHEKQLQLAAVMSESDAHASKCIKLGLNFQEAYPADYAVYTAAREQYNANEEELAKLEEIEPEIEEPVI